MRVRQVTGRAARPGRWLASVAGALLLCFALAPQAWAAMLFVSN